jgi:DNA-binding Lrp family transcriptional regulator
VFYLIFIGKLDSLDKSILKHLQEDGRLSLRDLGAKLNVPHTTVYTRIKKLVKNGVIGRFSAVMNPHDVGFKLNLIVVEDSETPDESLAEDLRQYSEVMKVFKSKDGKIFVNAVTPAECSDDACLKELKARLYGHNFSIHLVDEILKYDHKIHDELIDQMK